MKKLLTVVLGLSIFAAGCGSSSETTEEISSETADGGETSGETIEMKLHHDLAPDSPQHIAAEKFGEIVAEKTNGQVEVSIFPANQLGDDSEVAQMIQTGSVEAGLIPTAKLSTVDSRLQLPDLPFIFPNREAAYAVLDGEVGDALLEGLSDVNLKGIAFWESGFKQFTHNERIETPDDFVGSKIRTMESPIVIEQFRALGANPVPISFTETYNALQQGVVDGQENPLVSIVKMKFFEVQDYTILSNHGYLGYAFILSETWFDGLSEDIQTAILEAANETTSFERELTQEQEEEFIQMIKDSGTEVYELTEEQKEAFQEQTRSVHEKFVDDIGSDLLEKTYEIVESLE
ncbi:TRAP-type C4-dicarboxylate transport system [Halalkalibacter wakoensis JCM 9140]|uniref:TRAP-type C4-dicarboxylate transport system n=1 Tax=Halalkalibacter wakoensis JCM 9140 TaxID=1236970 RepID=W4Q7N7_9BACI|nr:TRAP transporter substrate-binding protein [Halalkalibacter wakoensis]GAE28091.1 TRAP-type C4-dicarboxylate transport system [Halalkalibacter wakoensis JCM 9140]